jgi:hypothetical protein
MGAALEKNKLIKVAVKRLLPAVARAGPKKPLSGRFTGKASPFWGPQ